MRQVTKQAILTPEEVAKRWKVHYRTVLALINSGDIPYFRVGRQIRISLDVVEDIEAQGKTPKE